MNKVKSVLPIPSRPKQLATVPQNSYASYAEYDFHTRHEVGYYLLRFAAMVISPEVGSPKVTSLKRTAFAMEIARRLVAGKSFLSALADMKFTIPAEVDNRKLRKVLADMKAATLSSEAMIERTAGILAQEYPPLSTEQASILKNKYVYMVDSASDPPDVCAVKLFAVEGVTLLGYALDTLGVPIKGDVVRSPYWAVDAQVTPAAYFEVVGIDPTEAEKAIVAVTGSNAPLEGIENDRAYQVVQESWAEKAQPAPKPALKPPAKPAAVKVPSAPKVVKPVPPAIKLKK